jgi:hypothetical protein
MRNSANTRPCWKERTKQLNRIPGLPALNLSRQKQYE